ncbi:MAG: sodium/proton antiporter NhaB [Steroidobacteraceae bacterium]
MHASLTYAWFRNFLGHSPGWYKLGVVACLALNPLFLIALGPVVTSWLIVAQFIGTLAMALKCYPLQPGGLLAIEAVILGLTDVRSVYNEVTGGLPVILLMVFMVSAIYFLRDLLLVLFTRLLLGVQRHWVLSLMFCLASTVLSAFLDALTVIAVVLTVGAGFYSVYHKVASGKHHEEDAHDHSLDHEVHELHHEDLLAFRGFLRGLLMHAAIGSALGGVMTQVGEPQNLLIAKQAGWTFQQFFIRVAPVSMPVFLAGLITCLLVERLRWFGYGVELPGHVRQVLKEHADREAARRSVRDRASLWVQAAVAVVLVLALGMHWAEVGLIGLLIIVLATSFMGITEEHRLGHAFETSLPFTALLVVFFAIVAMIHDQHLFEPVVQWVLNMEGRMQTVMFYVATGALSAVSDNVFVATIYISEIKAALLEGAISPQQFGQLAVAINAGTNIPSVATPNGQAAFLFMLTSALAPLIRLSYGRMLWMALPYTIVLTLTGLLATAYIL